MALPQNQLKCLNSDLPDDFEASLVADEGRIYYIDHKTQTSSWLPPRENWDPGNSGLPYGWEGAVDKNNKPYFINHIENYTTRDDPRDDPDYVEPPKPREVELVRDPQKGFGFVAGSEKPVVVRFVTEGGPSIDKLLPGDQLIKINGQDVKKAPREYVIDLVRSCKQCISLTVCQPYNDNSARKSALLTAAKKDRLKKNPSRVRFAENIIVNGASIPSNSPEESYVPFMPNVLKVFLENGQTKSFKYDNKTTVKDVMHSLQEKLNIKCVQHFNLVLHNMKSHMPGRMTLLQEYETVAEIAGRPGARHFRCLFRVMFVPRDSYDLLKVDPEAFEYFYMQCVNDILQERFASELKPDTILRLSALHIQQHAMSNNVGAKINIKAIEKEFGFEKFVPQSIRENMKVKDLRKVLSQSMKLNQNLTAPGQKQLTALQAKLHYMKIVSELKTFGSRVFMVTLLDKKSEAMVLVGPKAGISLVTNIRFYTLSMLADFGEIECIKVAKEKDNMNRVELTIKGDEPGSLNLGLLKEDSANFVCMVNGYFKIFMDPNRSLLVKNASRQSEDPDIPPYEGKHVVVTAPWSYPEDIVSTVITDDGSQGNKMPENERIIDLTHGPPTYEGNEEYISKLKKDLGIKSEPELPKTEEKSKEDSDKHSLVPILKERHSPVPASKVQHSTISVGKQPHSPVPIRKEGYAPVIIHVENPHPVTKVETTHSSKPVHSPIGKESRVVSPEGSTQGPMKTVIKVDDISRKHNADLPSKGLTKAVSQISDFVDARTETKDGAIVKPGQPKEERVSLSVNRNSRGLDEPSAVIAVENSVYKKPESGESTSDTDSGVGGEPEKQVTVIPSVIATEEEVDQEASDTDSWDMPMESLSTGAGMGYDLPSDDAHLDFSSMTDPMLRMMAVEEICPETPTTPDPDSTSFCPYDPDQLPPEILAASYDPRMFYQKEIYIDPDIIDLTLLPPFPPTQDEITEHQQVEEAPSRHPHGPLPGHGPISEHGPSHAHTPLTKTASVLRTPSPIADPHSGLQKSASLGYCPDFLDSDIDAFIDKLTVPPPPSDLEGVPDAPPGGSTSLDSDRLGQSWDERQREKGTQELEFQNSELSKTVDLGMLALEDNYSALVIPPPPGESPSLGSISIVPPVNFTSQKKDSEAGAGKRSKVRRKRSSSMDTFRKLFGSSSKQKEAQDGVDADDKNVALNDDVSSHSNSQEGLVTVAKTDDKCVKMEDSAGDSVKTDSPASVSEKLLELLKSLSSYEQTEEEAQGQFRRTSSLRLNRTGSLDFLPSAANSSTSSRPGAAALQTGSLRVKSRSRPSLDKMNPFLNGKGGPVAVSKPQASTQSSADSMRRNHSFDQLLTTNGEKPETGSGDAKPSETFAALKAKLQAYRDSLLSKSNRKPGSPRTGEEHGTATEAGSKTQPSVARSGSFTQYLQKSRRETNEGDPKGTRSSSATRIYGREDKENQDVPLSVTTPRDRKIWSTLATPRSSNFRPNTGTAAVQEPITKAAGAGRVSPAGTVESNSKKTGPLKALSSVLDGDRQTASPAASRTNGKLTPKRLAPEVPVSAVPPLPNAPPRRKHAPSVPAGSLGLEGEDSGSLESDRKGPRKSRDDSEIKSRTSVKTVIKTSPYATVGKMWRPISMATSASKESESEEAYRSYTNFDTLRDLSLGRITPTPVDQSRESLKTSKVPNGHLEGALILQTSSVPMNKAESKSVSDQSFALLREKVSPSHTDSVKQILGTVYTSEDFGQATNDVERLLAELKQTMESLKSSRIDRKPVQFDMCKDELQKQVRQFVTDAKLLVSNATQSKQKLATNMDTSMHSIARIFLHGQATMFMMVAVHQAQHLGSEVMRVANAYKSTLNAAHAAVGKPLADPHMKYLMRQATNLATLLSNLMKSLKGLEQS